MEANTNILLSIVGEDEEFLNFIRISLLKTSKFLIEREYSRHQDFFSSLPNLKSDIILVDSYVRGKSCLEFLKEMDFNINHRNVLVVDNERDFERIFRAIKLGAKGYITKSMSGTELIEILEDISNGGTKMIFLIIRKIIGFLEDSHLIAPDINFSSREKQILSLINSGVTCKEIALKLFLSQATVRTHIRNIKIKLKQNHTVDSLIISRHFRRI
jgi:DNA-binding NarL/FixJ family response regulator